MRFSASRKQADALNVLLIFQVVDAVLVTVPENSLARLFLRGP